MYVSLRTVVGTATLLLSLGVAQEAAAYKLLRGKGWDPSRVPVDYVVNPDGIPFAGVEAIKHGALMWSNKPQFDFAFRFAGTTTKRPASSPGSEHVVGMSRGLSMGVMAMCYYRFRGSTLDRFNIAYNARQNFSETRFTNTVIHEFGHALGLGHTRNSAAVMEAGSGSGNRLTDLHQDDINGAIALYPPTGNRPDLLPNALADPEITAPKGNVSTDRPPFQWTAVIGATGYEVALDRIDDAGQQSPVVRTGILATNAYAHPGALPPGRYFWWVRSRQDALEGQWIHAEFRVLRSATPPAKPQPQAPLAVVTSANPTFTWSAVTNAQSYDLSLDVVDASGAQVNVARTNVSSPSHTFPAALESGKTYYWWVRARDAAGQVSDWGFGQFTIQAALAAPTLIGPSGTVTGPQQTFSWSAVPGASHYTLQVHRAAGGAVVQESRITETRFTAQLPPGPYYWWVRAERGSDASAWASGAFGIQPPTTLKTFHDGLIPHLEQD